MTSLSIAVLGQGAWGTALAELAAEAGHEVCAWARHPVQTKLYSTTQDLSALSSDILITAIPVQHLLAVVQELAVNGSHPKIVINASKGLNPANGGLLTEALQVPFPTSEIGVLSGPNLAHEIQQGLPAASSLCCTESVWQNLQHLFPKHRLRLYHCPDRIGIQIGGALKNIIAIACGIADGLALGQNTRALLMSRGLHEIKQLGCALGADSETFFGLSGMGDVILTCSSLDSRNFKFGAHLIQSQKPFEQVLAEIGTVEGLQTLKSLQKLMDRLQVSHPTLDMPLCRSVYQVVYENHPPQQVIKNLLQRSLKSEIPTPHGKL